MDWLSVIYSFLFFLGVALAFITIVTVLAFLLWAFVEILMIERPPK